MMHASGPTGPALGADTTRPGDAVAALAGPVRNAGAPLSPTAKATPTAPNRAHVIVLQSLITTS
ncbi:hypothetical protein [Mycolicibacter sinensis]|jgi:hypothetical protein|uniref:hypothetical protein n=1 Tax=Mycolicibacter sinensis (strain JDM601) TaxID=875328 RepID=UPI0010426848|nr:hypothetical protein [Mycolicibacter sinensis]